jgi:uncharacterized membrane protein
MALLIVGLVLFLGIHSVSIVDPSWRDRVVARIGLVPWKGLFGVAALAGLVLVVLGYGMARDSLNPIVLYEPPTWARHLNLLLMLPVFPLLLAAYLPGRIQRATKHPMLLAVKIWAFGHLLANGTLADVLLFGSFLAWAVADRISLKRRTPIPVPGAPPGGKNDLIAVVGGLLLYLAFLLFLHTWLIGVSPLS